MTEPHFHKPRRRWFSLSLRGLMIAVLLIGVPLGWQARQASLQRRSVAAIKRLGGKVFYDWQHENGGIALGFLRYPPDDPPGPAWLRRFLGDEYFQSVGEVILPYPENLTSPSLVPHAIDDRDLPMLHAIDADGLACLDGLDRDRLVGLDLMGEGVGPEAMARLVRFRNLTSLSIRAKVGPAELSRLGELTKLDYLTVAAAIRTAADLAFLDRLPRLRQLTLLQTPITDAGLIRLGQLGSLYQLNIVGPGLTDAGLEHLVSLEALGELTIRSAPALTDAGLAHLARMNSLTVLSLPDTPVTEAGLQTLGQLPNLKELTLSSRSNFSQAGLDALKAAHPGIIVRGRP